jgi:hypothetical protein
VKKKKVCRGFTKKIAVRCFCLGGVKLTFSVSSIRIDVGMETVILRVRGDESRLKWLGQPGQRN